MDESPFDFIMNYQDQDLDNFEGFVHRTFNSEDLKYFVQALRHIYHNNNGLESVFKSHAQGATLQPAIHEFKKIFFSLPHQKRTEKHVSDPLKIPPQKESTCS